MQATGLAGSLATSLASGIVPFFLEAPIEHVEIHDEDNTDAFVISAQLDATIYHTNGLVLGDSLGWTFDAGGAGTSFPIASIADGAVSGVDIAVTTTGTHGLAVNDVVSQSNLTSAVYTGVFVVKAIISTTIYEVAAVFTATDTGTMDQAATLTALPGSAGDYLAIWSASMVSEMNNETFDFHLHLGAVRVVGANARHKFGTGVDFSQIGGLAIIPVADGDKVSFMVQNQDSAGDITIRNFTLVLAKVNAQGT